MLGEVDLRMRGRSSGSWRNIFRSEIVSRASLSELNVFAASVISVIQFLSNHYINVDYFWSRFTDQSLNN